MVGVFKELFSKTVILTYIEKVLTKLILVKLVISMLEGGKEGFVYKCETSKE